jgi:hypothetical protein
LDSPWVEPQAPELPASKLTVQRIADHLHLIGGLPYAGLTYTVTCGPFQSGEHTLDVRQGTVPRETVVMRRRALEEGEPEPGISIVDDGDGLTISSEGQAVRLEVERSSGG